MAALDLQGTIAVIRDGARKRGPFSAEFADGHGFHELIVTVDGTLAFNGYASEPGADRH